MRRGAKPTQAKVESKRPVAPTSRKNAGSRVRDLEKRLAEALEREAEAQEQLQTRFRDLVEAQEQQTATSEILKVISSSPTDAQPVFDTIVQSSARLCYAFAAAVFLTDGRMLYEPANYGSSAEARAATRARFPRPVGMDTTAGMAVLTQSVVHVPDTEEPSAVAHVRQSGRIHGFRSCVTVPMLRENEAVGAILVARRDPGRFSDSEVTLLKTFADQAVIAIENVRLFKELEARNHDLTRALDQQTATGEILRVISSSPTDVQPVFDSIVHSAERLLNGHSANVVRVIGDELQLAAMTAVSEAADAETRATFPVRLTTAGVATHVIRTRRSYIATDIETDPLVTARLRHTARLRGFRSMVMVPMVHQEQVIGVIGVTRRSPGAFSEDEVALLQTFADQAVIAIENVRLFTELQEKNRALTEAHTHVTEALERQTATAEILRIISHSQTNVQPVFDTIADNALRLFRARTAVVCRFDGELLHMGAQRGAAVQVPREQIQGISYFPIRPNPDLTVGRCALTRSVVHIADVQSDVGASAASRTVGSTQGWRSALAVPMMRDMQLAGVVMVTRAEPGAFHPNEIELLQTFADQAVIAIENARLLSELQARTKELTHSVEQLTALGEVGRALSSTLDLDAVLQTIVTRASQLAGTDACSVFEYDEATEAFYLRATNNLDEEVVTLSRRTPTRKGEGVQGRMAITRQPVQIPDIAEPDAYQGPLRDILLRTGTRAVLAIPMLREDELIGGLTVNKKTPGEFPSEIVELLKTFATQSALAIQNARLFREIEEKSRQLEAASQHKSEFLANMSHELRTPLNAVIGFSEVLSERMFGELNAKQDEYLKDIHASGQHLLSLINDILDLSKIEAGRMELEVTEFDLPMAIDNALTLVRERAARRSIALNTAVDEGVGQVRADERKIRQVLLNLLSNAIKFTPEGGRIHVEARSVNESIEVSVTDTGVGIAPEDQEAVFEEFRQVGTAEKKVEGTGLGLALSRKFIELHGGKIWVESQVGEGSTFTFTVPVRRGE